MVAMANYPQDDKKPSVVHVEHGQGGPDYMDDDGHMNKQFETDARGGSLGPIDEVASKALTRKVSFDRSEFGCAMKHVAYREVRIDGSLRRTYCGHSVPVCVHR
jgi:hypothetical protein